MVKDTGLKTADGDAPGSASWANARRSQAKDLAAQHETLYMELGRILYEIWDTPAIDRVDQKPWYEIWGYASFAEYAQRELDLQQRTAERLKWIWYRLEVDLKGVDSDLKTRLIKLGRSKAYHVLSALTYNNTDEKRVDFSKPAAQKMVEKWISFAETSPALKVEKAVQKLRNEKGEPKEPVPVRRSFERSTGGASEQPADSAEETPPANVHLITEARGSIQPPSAEVSGTSAEDDPPAAPEATAAVNKAAVPAMTEEEVPKAKNFYLYKDQREIITQALQRAEELSGSPKQGHNLTLVCTDFLATNSFKKSTLSQRLSYLAKLEKALGLQLIAFDPSEKKIVFGIETLERLSQEAQSE